MCGLAGFAGIKNLTTVQARIATNKMKLLGIFNQSRGTHGCGLYINGEIYKGVEDIATKKNTKEFSNFISDKDFIWPELNLAKGNIMFLHTRQATAGAHTEANTHPFKIKSKDPINDLVGAHNGTIDNIWDLCKKYDVDHAGLHIHVDSKALYYLIDKVGLNILKEYQGAAALLWTKPSDPHTLYLFHGATRKEKNEVTTYEERPMYYLIAAEGVYFSSLVSSLNAIRENSKQVVECLDYNKVFKITNGKFAADYVVIEREDANLKPEIVRSSQIGLPRPSIEEIQTRRNNLLHIRTIAEDAERSERLKKIRKEGKTVGIKTSNSPIIWRETKPSKAISVRNEEIVYFWKGRYLRSAGDVLCTGELYIKDRGVICPTQVEGAITYYFHHGVMLKNEECWLELIKEMNLPNSWVNSLSSNYAYDMSRFAMHAITHMSSESINSDDYFRHSWYFNERRVTCKLRPFFSGRCYDIEDGFLVDIIGSNGDDKKTIEGENEDLLDIDQSAGCGVNQSPVGRVLTTSVYDIVFKDMKTLCEILLYEEIEAMARFTEDSLASTGTTPSANTVQAEMWIAVRTGVAAGKTIREALFDTKSLLDSYLQIVLTEKKEEEEKKKASGEINFVESIEEAGNLVIDEAAAAYAKYGAFRGSEDRQAIVDAQTPFPTCLDDNEIDEETLIDHYQAMYTEDMEAAFKLHERNLTIKKLESSADASVSEGIQLLCEISTVADRLQSNDTDFAQQSAAGIYIGVGLIKKSLSDACESFFKDDLVKQLHEQVHTN